MLYMQEVEKMEGYGEENYQAKVGQDLWELLALNVNVRYTLPWS